MRNPIVKSKAAEVVVSTGEEAFLPKPEETDIYASAAPGIILGERGKGDAGDVTAQDNVKARNADNSSPDQAYPLNAKDLQSYRLAVPQRSLAEDWCLPGMVSTSTVCSVLLLSLFAPSAMRISAWAARHPKSARGALAGIHTVTIAGAALWGITLAGEGQLISSIIPGIAVALALTAALVYPKKALALENFTSHFLRRKLSEAMIFTCGTMILLTAVNHATPAAPDMYHPQAGYTTKSVPTTLTVRGEVEVKTVGISGKKQDPPRKKNVGLKILTIVLFTLATFGVAALSCSLACAGHEILALVFLGGAETGLVLAMISIFRSLNGTKRRRKSNTVEVVPETA